MPNLIGRIDGKEDSIKVSRETFKIFNEYAKLLGGVIDKYRFITKIFAEVKKQGKKLDGDSIKEYLVEQVKVMRTKIMV